MRSEGDGGEGREAGGGQRRDQRARQEARQAVSSGHRRLSGLVDRVEERLPPRVVEVVERLRDQDVLLFAAALAFYALISVVPFLLVGFWMTGLVVGEDRIEDMAERLTAYAPEDLEAEQVVRSLLAVSTGVGIGALVTALWPATAYGGGLARALDAISVDRDPALHGLRGRARALAVLVALPLFLLGALGTGYVATGWLSEGLLGVIAGWALAVAGGVAATWVGAAALYWWFGPAEVRWSALAWGAVAAAAAITLSSLVYLVYVGYGANWEERVAGSSVAAVILLALWFYLVNLLLLAGYCVALGIDERHGSGDDGGSDGDGDGPER
jgi:membrane protein